MTPTEILEIIRQLKSMGAVRVKVGECEVEFRTQADTDLVAAIEQSYSTAKSEIMSLMSKEDRAKLEEQIDAQLKYGSS